MTEWLDARPTKHPRTASRLVDGEAVIVLPEENVVKVLNIVGSRIWDLADGTRTVREIVQIIHQEFDVDLAQAKQDVSEFVVKMIQDELLMAQGSA